MIGDRVNLQPKHHKAARAIYHAVAGKLESRCAFAVAGQSGSGKSEVAEALARIFDEAGTRTFVFQQDDYFYYPPKTNHNRRLDDITWVGTQEVNLKLLDDHVNAFKTAATVLLEKPLVLFEENSITSEMVDLSRFNVAFAEGTYTSLLQNVDYRIFIDRDYHDTLEDRRARGRDVIDEFSERVLKIEDRIISKHKSLAHFIVNKDFSVEIVEDR
jgi:uridine kinase